MKTVLKEPETKTDPRPIWERRAVKGLSTPFWDEKMAVWSQMDIPQATIYAEKGGYKPFRVVDWAHKHGAMTIIVTGGVRGSKSVSSAAEAIAWSPHSDLIWFAGDTYDLARQEFEYTMEGMLSLGYTKHHYVTLPRSRYMPCTIETMWGTLIETRSLNDVNAFVARAPDLIVLCEPGLADPSSVQKARERLSTRDGRLWAAGTFEEARYNWLEEYWKKGIRWPNPESIKSFTVPTWLNRVSFPLGKHDPGIQLLRASCRSFEEFLLRCGGVPVPHQSQVIGDAWKPAQHVLPQEFTRRKDGALCPVDLAIDPGYSGGSHYVVLAIQRDKCPLCASEVLHILDEVAVEATSYQKVIEHCRTRDWWPNVRGGIIDPYAGGQHVFGGPSPQQLWFEHSGVSLALPARVPVEELVGLVKDALTDPVHHHPHVVVDPKCLLLRREMTKWRKRKTPDGFGKPSERGCDAVKALGYYIVNWMPLRNTGETQDMWAPRVQTFQYG